MLSLVPAAAAPAVGQTMAALSATDFAKTVQDKYVERVRMHRIIFSVAANLRYLLYESAVVQGGDDSAVVQDALTVRIAGVGSTAAAQGAQQRTCVLAFSACPAVPVSRCCWRANRSRRLLKKVLTIKTLDDADYLSKYRPAPAGNFSDPTPKTYSG